MAELSGFSGFYTMDGNSNCRMWADWETNRATQNGKPGWNVRIIIKANKTTSLPTYGTGQVQAGAHNVSGPLETKYIEIVQQERVYYDHTMFVQAEAGVDITLAAYANMLVPSVVSKGINFNVSVKKNLSAVYYNANGGTGAPSMQKKYWGSILTLSYVKPTRTGYNFLGWSSDPSATVPEYRAGDKYGLDEDVTFYAVWEKLTFTVTYDAATNGGTVNGAGTYEVTKEFQEMLGELPVAVRSGYKFVGWNTMANGKGAQASISTVVGADLRLYAIFELQANCYIRQDGVYVPGMMKLKDGKYTDGDVRVRVNGVYKETDI